MATSLGVRAWQVLIATAMEHRTITYGDLGKAIGHPARGTGRYLDEVAEYVRTKRLPRLTVIVVEVETGTPSFDYAAEYGINVDAERQRVFAHNWWRELPPP